MNTLHAHALSWVDKPLMVQNLFGGDEGLADSGVSVSKLILNPWIFLEATGELYSGSSGVFQSYRTERRELGRPAARLSRRHRIDQHRHRRLGRLRHQRRRPGLHDAARRHRRHVPLPSAAPRHLPAVAGPRPSSSGAGADRRAATPTPSACMRAASTSSRAAGSAAAATTGPSARTTRRSSTRDRRWCLTFWPSEFSQIRGQYRRTRYAEGATANELLFQFLFSIGAHGAHVF